MCHVLQVSRPMTMKKDGIQTRNRKMSTKSKKKKSHSGGQGGVLQAFQGGATSPIDFLKSPLGGGVVGERPFPSFSPPSLMPPSLPYAPASFISPYHSHHYHGAGAAGSTGFGGPMGLGGANGFPFPGSQSATFGSTVPFGSGSAGGFGSASGSYPSPGAGFGRSSGSGIVGAVA
jgi:hypothetical protein